MKTAAAAFSAVLVLGLTFPAVGGAEPLEAGPHHSTGLVVGVNTDQRVVIMRVNGHVHDLIVTKATVLKDDWGEPLAGLKALQVGDYVREHCATGPEGKRLARKIEVLRPAWRMWESPEW